MIRFRFREDEKRYLALVSEVYRIAAARLQPAEMSTVLRNLGKLQDVLLLEGVRQGVAAAAISNISKDIGEGDLEHLKAFQLHAHVYGSQDTPMRDIEEEWLTKLHAENVDEAWLDPEPMRFAPDTEHAALQEAHADHSREKARTAWAAWDDEDIAEEVSPHELPDEPFDIDALLAESERDDSERQERPDLLDRMRDALMNMRDQGLQPADWQDLVLRLHLVLQVDAGIIDLQLGTDMGRTVLSQAGFFDLQPGPFGTDLNAVREMAGNVAPTAPPTETNSE